MFKQGYTGFRPDVLALIPETAFSVIDFGCGSGLLARDIKKRNSSCRVVGIEENSDLIGNAKKYADHLIQMDLNRIPVNFLEIVDEKFDVVIFADVLEHLLDPEHVLQEALSLLKSNGVVITCLPNIRHVSLIWHVIFRGTWPRNQRGIFDKTHLHFYTRKNILEMLSTCGLEVQKETRNLRLIEPWSWTNLPGKFLDFWPFREFFTFQYLHCSAHLKNK